MTIPLTTLTTHQHQPGHDHHEADLELYDRTLFGFWIYILTDCILFSILFATYAVLHNGTFGGPNAKDLFSLPFALVETLLLLTSSFLCGLAMLAAHKKDKNKVLALFSATFLLGAIFLTMELIEFTELVNAGHTWQTSAFLSAFFTLVATHGLHISFGLLWIAVMLYLVWKRGLTSSTHRRLACLSLFWHFLDVIWIFIFTFVYLLGVQ